MRIPGLPPQLAMLMGGGAGAMSPEIADIFMQQAINAAAPYSDFNVEGVSNCMMNGKRSHLLLPPREIPLDAAPIYPYRESATFACESDEMMVFLEIIVGRKKPVDGSPPS